MHKTNFQRANLYSSYCGRVSLNQANLRNTNLPLFCHFPE
ncbi:hypothetical protein SD80_030010 [Scytonema tolypothrichoides VB-61278]|nr:hypothetical protein SD80_030010 [Scytonema tolypothrichoides VB-61278]